MITYLLKIYDRTVLLKFNYFFMVLIQAIMVFTNNIIIFCFVRFIIGVIIGIILPINLNVLCEYLPKKYRSYTMLVIWSVSFGQGLILIFMLIIMPNYQIDKGKDNFSYFVVVHIYYSIIFLYIFL